jgi:hypothetical protein
MDLKGAFDPGSIANHLAEKSPSRTVGRHELRHRHFNGKPVLRPLAEGIDPSESLDERIDLFSSFEA